MAGVTDLGFRTVCRELGAGYTVTEMVSAKALCAETPIGGEYLVVRAESGGAVIRL